MIREDFVTKAANIVAYSTLVGTTELTQQSGIELSIVLWMVGGLLAIIALLLGAIGYFIRDMRKLNQEQHTELTKGQKNFTERLIILETQHKSAYQARGCAYEPERMKSLIKSTLQEMMIEAEVKPDEEGIKLRGLIKESISEMVRNDKD